MATVPDPDAPIESMNFDEQTHFAATRRAPAEARSWLSTFLSAWHIGDLAEEAELLVSELVTNAVLHARTPLVVRAAWRAARLRVSVTDESAWLPRPRPQDVERVDGRGLALVETLADDWGVENRPGDGKTVWFELSSAPAEAAQGSNR